MKSAFFVALSFAAMLSHAFDGDFETDGWGSVTVDGIQWSYSFANDEASVCGWLTTTTISPGTAGAIQIPEILNGRRVTSIGEKAFIGCEKLTSVEIPPSVVSIGAYAFRDCSALTEVSIPPSVTNIGECAYGHCHGLTKVTIPPTVEKIGDGIFWTCLGLTSVEMTTCPIDGKAFGNIFYGSPVKEVVFSEGATDIGADAFKACNTLTSAVIPATVTNIGARAFAQCPALKSVVVPACVFGKKFFEVFEGSSVSQLAISEGVSNIDEEAFYDCKWMTEVTIPSSVTNIGQCAFGWCARLKSITIPPSVVSLADEAFFCCTGLTSVVMSEGVKSIGYRAFAWCESLTSVAIPASVEFVDYEAFGFCSSLTNIDIEADNVYYSSRGGLLCDKGGLALYCCPAGLSSVTIPDTVSYIYPFAFEQCLRLESVTIPPSVTYIGVSAFEYCYGLESVTIPSSVKVIDYYAFASCGGLTELVLPQGVESIGDYAFYDCHSLSSIVIPPSVTSIGELAFYDCHKLKVVYAHLSNLGIVRKALVDSWLNLDEIQIVCEGPSVADVGCFVDIDLVSGLGIVIPHDVDYAAGDKVTVKVEGLAKGLKVVATPVYEDPEAARKVIKDYTYTIEGVPTEAVDFDTQAMYARVSVTYKDKTIGEKGKVELLQPVGLSIATPEPSVLTAGVLNGVYGPVDITELWPAVADAKVNPKDWSFKGWPAGVKYNATTKDASWSYKKDGATVKTTAAPYTVYGQPTKAGEYPITATHKYKLADGKTTVSETFSAVLTVWGDDGATDFRYADQAYVETETKTLDETWKSFSGLPAGIKYTTKLVAADAKKGTPEYPAFSLYGTPTKPGVFAVTATKVDPADQAGKKTVKETFLWKVAPPDAPTFALDTGTAPVEDRKAQIVQGANQAFAITTSDIAAKVTVTGLPSGLKLVQDKTTKLYSVEGVASKPGEYFVTFKTVLNGVTTVTTTAFTVQGNPFVGTYHGYSNARPAVGAAVRLGVAEVSVAAAGGVKLTYTEGKTKYTASVKSFDWDDATGTGTAEGLVLKVSSADKKLGYGDRMATVTFEDFGAYLAAKLDIADADGSSLLPDDWDERLYATVKETEVPLPASQTFVFQTEDGTDTNALATVSVAYDAKKATAAFSGKLCDGTAVKATVPVVRRDDEGTSDDYSFAPFLVIAKDGTAYCFDRFSSDEGGGYVDWVAEDGESAEEAWSANADYALGDRKFAELVPEAGAFAFGWGSDAEIVGAATESFAFVQTLDKNNNPAGVAIYDADPQPGEKPLATVTAKVGKATGAISISFTSKKGDKAKYAAELVWRGDKLFAGHVTRMWKESDPVTKKSANLTASGTAEVK